MMLPAFRPDLLRDFSKIKKVKPGDKIFVGSSGDMWGGWVSRTWIHKVLQNVSLNCDYIFQFLTKNPERYGEITSLPSNAWYGTSVDGLDFTKDNIHLILKNVPQNHIKYISFEPLLRPVLPTLAGINWVIIGADSNPGAKRPPKKWADIIIKEADKYNIPVFIKDNYNYPTVRKEFPQYAKKHELFYNN